MQEPSSRTSRLAIAGVLLAVIAVGGTGFFLGRTTAPVGQAAPVAPAPEPSPAPTAEKLRVLNRADIVALSQRAADALASGLPVPAEVAAAAGRRFDVLIPFGCNGPNEISTLPMRWNYDAQSEALRVWISPVVWKAGDLGGDAAQAGGAEGFWITRPWSSSDLCPSGGGHAVPTGVDPITLPGQTLAIAQFPARANAGDGRAARTFETVQRVPADKFDASLGFRLRLTGRIVPAGGGAPVRCAQPAGPEQRPICVIAATLNEVSVENPATGETLATWPFGRSG